MDSNMVALVRLIVREAANLNKVIEEDTLSAAWCTASTTDQVMGRLRTCGFEGTYLIHDNNEFFLIETWGVDKVRFSLLKSYTQVTSELDHSDPIVLECLNTMYNHLMDVEIITDYMGDVPLALKMDLMHRHNVTMGDVEVVILDELQLAASESTTNVELVDLEYVSYMLQYSVGYVTQLYKHNRGFPRPIQLIMKDGIPDLVWDASKVDKWRIDNPRKQEGPIKYPLIGTIVFPNKSNRIKLLDSPSTKDETPVTPPPSMDISDPATTIEEVVEETPLEAVDSALTVVFDAIRHYSSKKDYAAIAAIRNRLHSHEYRVSRILNEVSAECEYVDLSTTLAQLNITLSYLEIDVDVESDESIIRGVSNVDLMAGRFRIPDDRPLGRKGQYPQPSGFFYKTNTGIILGDFNTETVQAYEEFKSGGLGRVELSGEDLHAITLGGSRKAPIRPTRDIHRSRRSRRY